jgi:hypothetical protein
MTEMTRDALTYLKPRLLLLPLFPNSRRFSLHLRSPPSLSFFFVLTLSTVALRVDPIVCKRTHLLRKTGF